MVIPQEGGRDRRGRERGRGGEGEGRGRERGRERGRGGGGGGGGRGGQQACTGCNSVGLTSMKHQCSKIKILNLISTHTTCQCVI